MVLACLGSQTVCFADSEYALRVEDKVPPEKLDAEIREKLAPRSYQISDAEGVFFEFWFVPGLEVSAISEKTQDTLENVAEIALLGALFVHREERYDFREDPIDPGVYVLRMALQPQNGDHMGTAPYDTFAILVPYAKDGELKEFEDHETMVELASEDTVAEHPPILSLQPMANGDGEFPRLGREAEHEWEYMCLKFPARAGDQSVPLPVLLVFDGIGEL